MLNDGTRAFSLKIIKKIYWHLFVGEQELIPENNRRIDNINLNSKVQILKQVDRSHFLVVGHAYGHHLNDKNPAISKGVLNSLKNIKNESSEFLILNGDFLRNSKEKNIKALKYQIEDLNINTYLVRGNKELYADDLFLAKYGGTYYSFEKDSIRHLILDAESPKSYEISNEQIEFLSNKIDSANESIICIYTHKLVWLNHSPVNKKIDNVGKLYFQNSFWKKIFPILKNSKKKIYWFAGDVGGVYNAIPGTYEKIDNVYLISSGLGHMIDGNYLVAQKKADSLEINIAFFNLGKTLPIDYFEIND